jgi:hypothetical protein
MSLIFLKASGYTEEFENPEYISNHDLDFDFDPQPTIDINDFLKKDGLEVHNGGNFQSIAQACTYILSLGELFTRNPTLLSFETKVSGRMATNQDFFIQLLRKFDNTRSVLICFESQDDKSYLFAWSFKNDNQFFCLLINSDDHKIAEHVKKFLFTSLKHGHNGEFMH